MKTTTFLSALGLIAPALAGYTLDTDFMQGDFFSHFDFFTGGDPTNGFVDYLSQSDAQAAGLLGSNSQGVTWGVDHTSVLSPTGAGRKSVRLTSQKSWTHMLAVLEADHLPVACGTWPAFWTTSTAGQWPNFGEIDIIEGVNDQAGNAMTLHTAKGCNINGPANSLGSLVSTDCYAYDNGNEGCSIHSNNAQTYGQANSVGGGVWAMEWTSSGIQMWWWPTGSSSIPADIHSNTPNPDAWGTPIANFQGGGCDWDNFFQQQSLIFDTTFCGDWAGNAWSGSSCPSSTGQATCIGHVASNPGAFTNAYWGVSGLRVYTTDGNSASNSNSNNNAPSPVASPAAAATSAGPAFLQTSASASQPTPLGSSALDPAPAQAPAANSPAAPAAASPTPVSQGEVTPSENGPQGIGGQIGSSGPLGTVPATYGSYSGSGTGSGDKGGVAQNYAPVTVGEFGLEKSKRDFAISVARDGSPFLRDLSAIEERDVLSVDGDGKVFLRDNETEKDNEKEKRDVLSVGADGAVFARQKRAERRAAVHLARHVEGVSS